MSRPFTGRHMFAILVGLFGLVIAVNFIMARYAVSTCGGTVVDNSYVASQRFNEWLADARDQQALGWTTELGMDKARRLTVSAQVNGVPLEGVRIVAVAAHPLGRATDFSLTFDADGAGRWRSREMLPDGRWNVRFELRRGKAVKRLLETLG